jgi:hypothetical protein
MGWPDGPVTELSLGAVHPEGEPACRQVIIFLVTFWGFLTTHTAV